MGTSTTTAKVRRLARRLLCWCGLWLCHEVHQCDGCLGTFREGFIHPVSGDWWLCSKCFDEYMRPDDLRPKRGSADGVRGVRR